jgi:hypothetical protein
MFALNADAFVNMPSIAVTAAVFHALISAVKAVWFANKYVMSVTKETSQVLISPQSTPPQIVPSIA